MNAWTEKETDANTIRLVVDQHPQYQSEAPELFNWEQVINPKVAGIALLLVQDIKDRRHEWPLTGKKGMDPCLPGLLQALRIIARAAVWSVRTEQKIRPYPPAPLGLDHAPDLSIYP